MHDANLHSEKHPTLAGASLLAAKLAIKSGSTLYVYADAAGYNIDSATPTAGSWQAYCVVHPNGVIEIRSPRVVPRLRLHRASA